MRYYKYDRLRFFAGVSDIPCTCATITPVPDEPLAEGKKWRYLSGVWIQVDPIIIPSPPEKTLDEMKARAISDLHIKASKEFDEYMGKYPKGEIDTFERKASEAIAWRANKLSSTPFIDSLLTSDGTREELLNAILQKVDYLAEEEAKIRTQRDKIKACQSKEELQNLLNQ